jgi:ankyrin repeat protein
MTFEEAHRLIKKGDLVSLRHEFDGGLSPSLANQFSWTLLMLAAMEGDVPIGEFLLSKGGLVDAANDFGETALSLAAHKGHTRFIRVLLANGASRECRPHGHSLGDWLKVASGLTEEKIESILKLLDPVAR